MGSHDLVTTFEPTLSSRSCDSMDYAAYNVRYQEDFNIRKTRPRYGGKELQSSMLAYTNYVVERQHRYQQSQPGSLARRHSLEISQDIQSRQVSNSSKFPGINFPFSKIPVLSKHKSGGGRPRLSERYNKFKSEQGILRGHTFPPLDGKENGKSRKASVTISVATVSDLYDVTDSTRCEAKVSEVINHDKLHAWLATEQSTPEPDLSSVLTTSKPAIRQHSRITYKTDQGTKTAQNSDNSNHWDKAKDTVFSDKAIHRKQNEASEDVVIRDDNLPGSPGFSKTKQSEDLLKSAIKTLKLMEKELDELPKEVPPAPAKEKPKKKTKKSKRLQLPEQTLDIIPELECEALYASSPDGGYSSEVSPACVHYSKRSKVDSAYDGDSDDIADDGIDHDIDDEEPEPEECATGGEYVYKAGRDQNFYSTREIKGQRIGSQSVPALPPIGHPHRGGGGMLVQGLVYSSVSKLDKVKSEIRSKIKRKHKHVQ